MCSYFVYVLITDNVSLYIYIVCVCVFQAAICRCSQPLAGFSARCVEDEQMLQCILKANPKSRFMFVVDTRPKVSYQAQLYLIYTFDT